MTIKKLHYKTHILCSDNDRGGEGVLLWTSNLVGVEIFFSHLK